MDRAGYAARQNKNSAAVFSSPAALVLILCAAVAFFTCGCGAPPAAPSPAAPTAVPTAAPTPSPEPTPGIALGTGAFFGTETELELSGSGAEYEGLAAALGDFGDLTHVIYSDCEFTTEEQLALVGSFPDVVFDWPVRICGAQPRSGDTTLALDGQFADAQALAQAAPLFSAVERIELPGAFLEPETVAKLRAAYGGAVVICDTRICGLSCATDAAELDLTGCKVESLDEIRLAAAVMPELEKLIMPPDCGFDYETLDALDRELSDVRVVWTVRFSVYTLRTDVEVFCASNLPQNGYVAIRLTDEQIDPLKYCTDLMALDLGHMNYTDLSFLQNMSHLKYLILVEALYSDISVIASLPELYYLELFNNRIDDLSPLLECKSLRHLNVGYCRGAEAAPLYEMTWLERLWYPGNKLTEEERVSLAGALPDTECYLPAYDAAGSTGGGWREGDVYREMRNTFSMFYQPGGTGVK